MLAGGRGSWGCIIFWKIQYTIITPNLKGGRQQSRGGEIPPPPQENTLRSSFHQNFEEIKGYII